MSATTDSKENKNIDYDKNMDDRDKELVPGYKPLLFGSNGGECPSPAVWSNKNKECCCGPDCCWDQCIRPKKGPPEHCLQGVQNSKWVLITSLSLGLDDYYQAFQKTGISLTFHIYLSGFFLYLSA